MGTWGTGILDDDLARDVYDAYTAGVDGGEAPDAVIIALRHVHAAEIEDVAQDTMFWLAVAQGQRDRGGVQPDVRARVTRIVREGIGLEPWVEAGRTEAGRRKTALTKFLASLDRSAVRPARRPTPPAAESVDVAVGDCLGIALADGRFAAAVVTRTKRTATTASHILTFVNHLAPAAPTPSTFAPVQWLILAPQQFPGLAVKFEVYDDGLARHRRRYPVVTRIDPGAVPEPLVLRHATWATLWRVAADALVLTP